MIRVLPFVLLLGMASVFAQPATLPFEQASKFELIVNMKTAAALGVTVPPALVLRADRTIY